MEMTPTVVAHARVGSVAFMEMTPSARGSDLPARGSNTGSVLQWGHSVCVCGCVVIRPNTIVFLTRLQVLNWSTWCLDLLRSRT